LVEFNKTPPPICREVDGMSWDRIHDGWKNKLLSTMFDEPGEKWHADNPHKTYLPDTDPLFSFFPSFTLSQSHGNVTIKM
jgi:hypothetical protein